MCQSLSHVQLCATPWIAAHQTPLPMIVYRQEYWSGQPFPSPADLPDPGIEPAPPALEVDSLHLSHQGSPKESPRRASNLADKPVINRIEAHN